MNNEEIAAKKNIKNGENGKEHVTEEINVPFYKNKMILFAIVIIVIAAIGSWYWYQGTLGFVSTDDAFIDGNKLSLSSQILGRIVNLNADEGDEVHKGDILVKLDSVDIVSKKNQATASLKLARENLKLSKINLEGANEDFNRAKSQFESDVIPKEQYDHARKKLLASQAEFDISAVKIKAAEANLNAVKSELRNYTIISPMNGRIAKKWVLLGDVVQPGEPIFSIYNLDSIWVTSEIQETDMMPVHVGENVEIFVDTYPNQKFEGKVFQIGSNTASQFSLIPPNNASGNFTKITQRIPVKISIEPVEKNKNLFLLPGMSVEVSIDVK